MNYLKMWCEWDYEQDQCIFASEQAGKDYLTQRIDPEELRDMGFNSIEQIFEENLAGFSIVELVP